ncbi:hypothetical protein FRC10_000341 [Ceratobasidium sp. 414]|nr:hypothetical protein FRC10_000341 [Ceratobasidium sp. 414]
MQSSVHVGQPEDLASPCRGCWRSYDDILRIKKVHGNRSSFAKVYTKTEAEWTLSNSESFKMLLATSSSLTEFQQKLSDIFTGREEILIGDELQALIYDHASQALPQCSAALVSPFPSPSHSPVAESLYSSQSPRLSQVDHEHSVSTVTGTPSYQATRPAQGFPKEPIWPNSQYPSPRPHRPIIKGSVANVLRRYSIVEEANRRFRIFQALGSGTPAFEMDVAYELQAQLQAYIRKCEDDMFGREGRSWH